MNRCGRKLGLSVPAVHTNSQTLKGISVRISVMRFALKSSVLISHSFSCKHGINSTLPHSPSFKCMSTRAGFFLHLKPFLVKRKVCPLYFPLSPCLCSGVVIHRGPSSRVDCTHMQPHKESCTAIMDPRGQPPLAGQRGK